ncbi:unnamed protein product [Penicillium salamii]|uniref:NACHT domain-containing protein n=1 Tax=Penicillium salamii TaxID=1612424 RepID=A0A9W4J5Z7_9EURO|nr:unnamed protein product [Penicillium salamii]
MEQVSVQISHMREQNEILIHENNRRGTYQTQNHAQKTDNCAENKEILNWVSTALPHDDHTRILDHGKLNSDYAQSGKWLFRRSEFESWNTNNDSQSVLWLLGPVGTGKSSLVCLTIEQLLNQSRAIDKETEQLAFFYCSRKQGTEEANIASIIKERYQQWQQDQGYGGRELLADDCVKLLTQLIAPNHHTKIIIDALDECSDFDELLNHLEKIISASQGKVKFLLSSRMHVPVHEIFPANARIEVGMDNKEDIETFIKTKIEQNQRRLDQCKSSELKDRIIKTLSDRAQGMFRWVELQLDVFFNPKSKIRRPGVFKRKLESLESGSGIPELDEVYDEIYDMNVSTDEDRRAAERTLKWLMCCQKPLSIEVLVKAVSFDSNGALDQAVDEDYLLAICSNFIIIYHNQMVQFAHLSVREYLASSAKHSYSTANAQTARTSLLYLLNECSQGDADPSKRDGFVQYAALYWPVHYSLALDDDKEDFLLPLINELLSPSEPSDGFTTCLQIWADALDDIESSDDLHWRIGASLNATKSPVFTACVWGFHEVAQ